MRANNRARCTCSNCARPPPGQLLIEMLPGAGQRLLADDGFGPQPLAVRAAELVDEVV